MDLIRTTLQPDFDHMRRTRHIVGELQSFRSQTQARSQKIPYDLKIRIDNIIERQEKFDKLKSDRKLSNGSPSRNPLTLRLKSEMQNEKRKQSQLEETISSINDFESKQIFPKRFSVQSVYSYQMPSPQKIRTMSVFEKREVLPEGRPKSMIKILNEKV